MIIIIIIEIYDTLTVSWDNGTQSISAEVNDTMSAEANGTRNVLT